MKAELLTETLGLLCFYIFLIMNQPPGYRSIFKMRYIKGKENLAFRNLKAPFIKIF